MARLLQGQRVCLQRARREPWRTGSIRAYTNLFYTLAPETLELEFPFATFGVVCGSPLHHLDGTVPRLLPNPLCDQVHRRDFGLIIMSFVVEVIKPTVKAFYSQDLNVALLQSMILLLTVS